MTTLLIDTDIFAFKAASARETVVYFNGRHEEPAVAGNLDEACETARSLLEEVAIKLKATRLIMCLTDDTNFRTGVYPQYKGNRSGTRRPSTLKDVKAMFSDTYETYQRPGLEADDCMGILSTHKTLIPGKKIIVSEDKDMGTVPGFLFNPAKDKEVRTISEVAANRYFMKQTLIGDSTDGYPGCRGIGKDSKLLPKLEELDTMKDLWAFVKEAYASKGFTPSDALVQARCARILRASDWDFAQKKVRLWSPPV